jgi:hypothetical protein
VFFIAAVCWIAGAVLALGWILSFIISDPSAHTAGDALLALIITSPLYLIALAGVAVLFAGYRSGHVSLAAIGWSVIALCAGLVASTGPLTLVWTALTTGGVEFTPGGDWIATYPQGGATYYLYSQDLLPLWFAVWGLVALVAAVRARRSGAATDRAPEPRR